ncbi:dihydrolipoamide acetyltransferase family protein [Streptomyces brasiliensis]|uniref:Dihydrolipoamide acetyltransferase component of pyruvate dehydrogenase complex n=1 Tax=Streptomyces brasiliensis TaxID=1954 RepID=A0A917P8V9_9ACTN|nr:dihydrolipoamide acetyltransferase family protein [Streptomyces brasiliensis]GGJ67074.1 dihydrolipoamide acetyltransferase component of pyruvate dehydrogenase complex [Streptomyces brasiliensis]
MSTAKRPVTGPPGIEHFRLPDVGEGLVEAEIVTWQVAVGDTIEINQVILEIETAKSLVELPSPFAGTVTAIHAAEGETVEVGTALIAIATDDAAAGSPDHPDTTQSPASTAPEPASAPGTEPRPSVLVGYGPWQSTPRRRRRRRPLAPASQTAPVPSQAQAVRQDTSAPAAKPPVRKLAKDLDVNLAEVVGSGAGGLITREDVLRHAAAVVPAAAASHREADKPPVESAGPATTSTDGEADVRIPVKGVRKATAATMTSSAFTAPHVTEFLTVDVTRSVKLVERLKAHPALEGTRVTFLLVVARALLAAVRQLPDINASWDAQSNEIVRYRRVNLGIAAATPRGLLVPNIKDAGSLSLPALACALNDLVRTARDGRTAPQDLTRGTITITNIGVFGIDAGTPILNLGEAAILCVGAVRRRPWEHKGRVALRWTTQLALSFDHRLVDGELGSKVLARVGTILRDPERELLLS